MKLGMIGLGAMGHSVAQNIMKAGHEITLYDVRPEAYADLVAQGARGVDSLQEMGRTADTIFMMVNTYPQCQSVVSGLLETMNGGVIINLSTIAMNDAQELGKLAAAHGVDMLDCPVSGGTRGAADGKLTLMVSGKTEVFEAVLPVMESFATNPVLVGTEVGQGQAVKTINQLLVGVHMCATAEAFTLAKKCGLDLKCVYDVVCASAGMSRIFENRGQFVIDRDFNTRSTLQIQLKDTNIVCQTADAVGAPTLLANTARELFKLAVKKYPPTDDSLEVLRVYEELGNCAED